MPLFNYNQGNINYSVKGEGQPIVLIHGFGLDSRIWKQQVEELSKDHKVITYDLRGFGKSDIPTTKYSHHEDLHALLEKLEVKEPKLVGHSFGGEVAIEYALNYPNETNSLVLVSSSLSGIKGDSTEWEVLLELGKVGDIEGMRKKMLDNPIFKSFKEGSEELKLITEIVNEYKGFHLQYKDPREYINESERLKELSLPIDVVIGENDLPVQKEIAEKFKVELGIEFKIIPNCGHMVILENAEVLNEIIKETGTEEYHSEFNID